MSEVLDAGQRIARVSLQDGLAALFFGLFFLITGSIDLIGRDVPRDSVLFDVFHLGFLQVVLIAAAFFGIQRTRSRFVVPRIGFVKPKPPTWYHFGVWVALSAAVPIFFFFAGDRRQGVEQMMTKLNSIAGPACLSAMFFIIGWRAKLPRMLWLASGLMSIGLLGYWRGASYPVSSAAAGAAITLACLLQFRSFMKAHPNAEREA